MKDLLQYLIKLQSIEFGEIKTDNAEAAGSELRGKIPSQILAHYDRLVAKGKKGIAAVRNQGCTGCHMQVPLGTIMTLRHGNDIQLCGNCGRYLYLVETPQVVEEPEKKRVRRRRASSKTVDPLLPATGAPTRSVAVAH
jgi:predicted  nucleic acid-binding Zn-ribbon protein